MTPTTSRLSAAMANLLTEPAVTAAIGPLDDWAHNCHAASIALVRSGLLPSGARVARGSLRGVMGQHSWAVLGDPYLPELIVDITAWSYDDRYPRVLVTTAHEHQPNGMGSIWRSAPPECGSGPAIELAPSTPLSARARQFLATVASLSGRTGIDIKGWMRLANSPILGWPAKEIITAMYETPQLRALIPVDTVGMLTDLNPGGLYW